MTGLSSRTLPNVVLLGFAGGDGDLYPGTPRSMKR